MSLMLVGIFWKQLLSRTPDNSLWLLYSVISQSQGAVIEDEVAQPLELYKMIRVNVFQQSIRV